MSQYLFCMLRLSKLVRLLLFCGTTDAWVCLVQNSDFSNCFCSSYISIQNEQQHIHIYTKPFIWSKQQILLRMVNSSQYHLESQYSEHTHAVGRMYSHKLMIEWNTIWYSLVHILYDWNDEITYVWMYVMT